MGRKRVEPRKETRMHKTTLILDDGMWRATKIRAMDEGTSLQKIVEAALALYLKAPKKGTQ
jgi:predicted HicB family RNase H-like nuclease